MTTSNETSGDDTRELEQTACFGAINHLPVWSAYEPERVEGAVMALIEETEAAFQRLETQLVPTWAGLMSPLEALELRLGRVLGAVVHLLSVKYSDALQAAYDGVRPRYVTLSNAMAQSRAVYAGMVALKSGAEWERLDPARQRVLTESIRGMERSGVHLEGEERERYQEIQQRLSELSNNFQTNLVKAEKASRIIVADADRVAGVPPAVLELAAATAVEDGVENANAETGPWHFAINGVNYMAALQHGSNRSLREEFYRSFRARGTQEEFDNRPVLEEMLRLRQEMARLVGFHCFADLSIDAKMARDTGAVWSLFNELEAAARPAARREADELLAYMRSVDGDADAELAPWDIAFWSERLSEERYGYDAERLRDYFQMPRVLDGLYALTKKLYDVDIRRVPAGAVPVWDDSVEFFEVMRDDQVIAGFYVDPYARPGEKRGGAWMNTIVGRTRMLASDDRSSSLPVALFVMNSRPPVEGKAALMSLDEVRTLFHEFGHATQHMFTTVEEGGASGMNLVEWDAVELASQFNEYWMEHKPFLKNLTEHVDTGERLEDETIGRIVASRNFMVGTATLRQLQFGKTDMALHETYGLPGVNIEESPFELERRVAAETIVMPMLPDETQLPAFGHLFGGGYAAGYYSYKWAEVLAADAFAAFKEVGLDDESAVHTVAQRFRDTVLGLGGSLPAAEVYRLFRGRDASADALLVDQGLKPLAQP